MNLGRNRINLSPALCMRSALAMILIAGFAVADGPDEGRLGSLENHPHAPIVVPSRPVIERLPIQVISPTDLCTTPHGDLLIADRGARVVFRMSTDGSVAIAARDLNWLTRIRSDRQDNLFVLSSAAGGSQITQVTPTGKRLAICSLPFAAASFTRDSAGSMFVGNLNGEIWSVSPEGTVEIIGQIPRPIVDMTLSSSEQLHVLADNGKVLQINAEGDIQTVRFAQPSSRRLFALPQGNLATLCTVIGSRPMITLVSDREAAEPSIFANVPTGTVAIAFDQLGNLSMANPDLRAITRVTSRFQVPCPHCGKDVEMVLSADPAGSGAEERSF